VKERGEELEIEKENLQSHIDLSGTQIYRLTERIRELENSLIEVNKNWMEEYEQEKERADKAESGWFPAHKLEAINKALEKKDDHIEKLRERIKELEIAAQHLMSRIDEQDEQIETSESNL